MGSVWCWLSSSMERVYKGSLPQPVHSIHLDLGRCDRGSFQANIRKDAGEPAPLTVEADAPDGIELRIRRVGYVPVPHFGTATEDDELEGIGHIPGFVPDPLFDDLDTLLPRNETATYWFSVYTSADTKPGTYPVRIRFLLDKEAIRRLDAVIRVYDLCIKPRENFRYAHWFYADALCDWYKVDPFDERFWAVLRPYMENLSSHLNDVMYVPIFTPPTDGVKRPHQLLKIMKGEDGRYLFDWRDVRRWVSMARSCGLEYFEWTHLFTQWGAKYAIRIYENWDGDYRRLLWPPETLGTSDAYRDFLSQFLPEFKRFLEEEGIMERSLFHISDEPHGDEHLENYRKCSGMVREIAPWIKVMDAQSDPAYARLGLTDIPIAGIHVSEEFNRLGIPHFDYYCCGPRGKFFNRHLDVPLVKVRGTAWVLYRFKSLGFLHWGYNYWYKAGTTTLIDPYCVTDGLAWPIWAYGDTFVVFPGEEGPVDSIRWEVLADSFSDYALLQSCGVDPEDPLLGQIQSYEEFPKYKEWYGLARAKLLSGIGDKWKSCRKAVEKPSKGHREAV